MSVTREAVRLLLDKEPTMNCAQVARLVGVTRERVRQIREELGLPPAPRTGSRPCAAAVQQTAANVEAMLSRVAASESPLRREDIAAGIVSLDALTRKAAYKPVLAANNAKRKSSRLRELLRSDPTTPYSVLAEHVGIPINAAGAAVASLERQDGCNYRQGRRQLKPHPLTVTRRKVA